MRSFDEIRETAFIVARQYLAVEGARERPIEPVYQLHLDAIDMLAALAEKDAEIERLQEVFDREKATIDKILAVIWEAC